MAAATACMKRLVKERERLPKDNDEFWIGFKDDNLRQFTAYIVGPDDSCYKHKLIKLKFDVPEQYPLVPPKVTFVQHTGDRIHPNLYTEGKVCLSILGTWPGDPWTYSMRIESVLITIRSLLDNKPYMHEPHQKDRPTYNNYVRYETWRCLLIDYLEREQDPEARKFLAQYVQKHGDDMIKELERQKSMHNSYVELTSAYGRRIQITPDYDALLSDLQKSISKINDTLLQEVLFATRPKEHERSKRVVPEDEQNDSPTQKKSKPEPTTIDLTDDS